MSHKYSFIGNSSLLLLKTMFSIIPSLSRLVLVYYSELSKQLEIKFIKQSNGNIEDFPAKFNSTNIEKYRRKKSSHEWLKRGDEPFHSTASKGIEPEIFDEEEKTILCLRIPSSIQSDAYDLLFFYFKQDMTNFGPNKRGTGISTENKKIIRIMLERTIEQLLVNQENDYRTLIRQNQIINETVEDYKEQISELKNQIASFAIHYINKINSSGSYQYIFSKEALEKIKNYKGELFNLNGIIDNAISFATNLNPGKTLINIDASIIRLNPEKNAASKTQSQQLYIKYPEVAAFLDMYEEAIQAVINKGEIVKSETVGKHLIPKPVKPAAISLAIKKRSKKIAYLMQQYETRWPLIRKEFTPIQNVLRNDHGGFQEAS